MKNCVFYFCYSNNLIHLLLILFNKCMRNGLACTTDHMIQLRFHAGDCQGCIHYVYCCRRGRGYFLTGQFFLISQDPPHHTEFFDNPPLDQKKNGNPSPPLPSMTRKVTDMDTLTHSLTYAHECLQACRVGTKDHHSCLF